MASNDLIETTLHRERVLAEIDTPPDEYLPFVLRGAYAAREHRAKTSRRKLSSWLDRGKAGVT